MDIPNGQDGVIVTVQSVTCQPYTPCRSVSATVSSTALKNAYGIEPELPGTRVLLVRHALPA